MNLFHKKKQAVLINSKADQATAIVEFDSYWMHALIYANNFAGIRECYSSNIFISDTNNYLNFIFDSLGFNNVVCQPWFQLVLAVWFGKVVKWCREGMAKTDARTQRDEDVFQHVVIRTDKHRRGEEGGGGMPNQYDTITMTTP